METLKGILGNTKNAILATGALAGAIVAVYSAGTMLVSLGNDPHPKPPASKAVFTSARARADVPLEEFEARDAASLDGASVDDRRVVDARSASAGTPIAIQVAESESTEPKTTPPTNPEEPPSTTSSTPSTNPQSTTPQTTTTTTPTTTKPATTSTTTSRTTPPSTPTPTPIPTQTTPKATPAQDFAKPPPPQVPFHREGHAEVLNGAGTPTVKVDAVLRKARALLARQSSDAGARKTSFSGGDAGFGRADAIFSATSDSVRPSVGNVSSGEAGRGFVLPSRCGQGCGVKQTIEQAIDDSNSNLAEAARKVVTVFTHARGHRFGNRIEPLGATVNYAINLVGFAHDKAILEWTLESDSGEISDTWWRKVIVKQVVHPEPEEPVYGTFWAPIPPHSGDYFFRLLVFDSKGHLRGEHETNTFH